MTTATTKRTAQDIRAEMRAKLAAAENRPADCRTLRGMVEGIRDDKTLERPSGWSNSHWAAAAKLARREA